MTGRKIIQIFLFIATVLLLIVSGCGNKNTFGKKIKVPRLEPKYSFKDKEPMGTYIAYHYLNALFDYGINDVKSRPFSKHDYNISYSDALYIIVTKGLFINKQDLAEMLNYVNSGNTIFISAGIIDNELLDTLGVDMSYDMEAFFGVSEYKREKKDTWVNLVHDSSKSRYGFYFVPFDSWITNYDSASTQLLGYAENNRENLVAVQYGQGKFIFHTAPATFSNYFLLTGNNREYLEKMFSYFKPGKNGVYWDNYYRAHRSWDDDFSIAGFFKKHPPLYYAFLLVLALLLLFIAFGGKRKRRLVPEKIPNINTTVSYTETIGRLYLQKKDNRNIALKMFAYFLEQVRTNYFLNTQTLNNEFAESLSRKSNVPQEKVRQLLDLVHETDNAENISDIRLFEIHNLLQEFFKK